MNLPSRSKTATHTRIVRARARDGASLRGKLTLEGPGATLASTADRAAQHLEGILRGTAYAADLAGADWEVVQVIRARLDGQFPAGASLRVELAVALDPSGIRLRPDRAAVDRAAAERDAREVLGPAALPAIRAAAERLEADVVVAHARLLETDHDWPPSSFDHSLVQREAAILAAYLAHDALADAGVGADVATAAIAAIAHRIVPSAEEIEAGLRRYFDTLGLNTIDLFAARITTILRARGREDDYARELERVVDGVRARLHDALRPLAATDDGAAAATG